MQFLLGPDLAAIDLADNTAVAKHEQAIADGEQLDQLRRDDEDSFAAIRQRADHPENFGLGGEPFADDDLLLIAAREQSDAGGDRARLDTQVVDDRSGHAIATSVV